MAWPFQHGKKKIVTNAWSLFLHQTLNAFFSKQYLDAVGPLATSIIQTPLSIAWLLPYQKSTWNVRITGVPTFLTWFMIPIQYDHSQQHSESKSGHLVVSQFWPRQVVYIVQPRLSRLCLPGTSIIWTSWRPENTLPCMHRRCSQWSLVGVVTGWAMSYTFCRYSIILLS